MAEIANRMQFEVLQIEFNTMKVNESELAQHQQLHAHTSSMSSKWIAALRLMSVLNTSRVCSHYHLKR
jgi:hypothetical protein